MHQARSFFFYGFAHTTHFFLLLIRQIIYRVLGFFGGKSLAIF